MEVPQGPFRDQGLVLSPRERSAIGSSPCRLPDGRWWRWFARDVLDVLDDERAVTHLAGEGLLTPTTLGPVHEVLAPYPDRQVLAHDRGMRGLVRDGHALQGSRAAPRARSTKVLTVTLQRCRFSHAVQGPPCTTTARGTPLDTPHLTPRVDRAEQLAPPRRPTKRWTR